MDPVFLRSSLCRGYVYYELTLFMLTLRDLLLGFATADLALCAGYMQLIDLVVLCVGNLCESGFHRRFFVTTR